MQAQLVVSETNTAVADPNLFLAGLSPRGVEEFYLYHPAQGAVGLLRDKLSTSGRIGRLGVDTGVAVGLAEANSLTADIVGDSPQVTEAYKPVEPHEGQSLMWPGGALKEQIRLV